MTSDLGILSRSPVPVTVAGLRVLLPFRPAAEWVTASDRVEFLVSFLASPEDRNRLTDLALESPARVREDLRTESFRILDEAGGRKWWEVLCLLRTSTGPEVLGRLVLAGVDPWSRSVGEWCAATYALCVKGLDEKGRLKLDFSLSIPPPGFEDEWDDGDDDPEATAAAVAAMMGKR